MTDTYEPHSNHPLPNCIACHDGGGFEGDPCPCAAGDRFRAPAVEVTPLGLAYLLPGIEPRPRVLAEGVNQSAMF